ncbi:MAG: efflux RND transporter periplasmic adaptor subunit [Bacteroidales bacterium]|nr:efflux RND transporter periplasmic adaptor subunit [Bacteroidales bacterium]
MKYRILIISAMVLVSLSGCGNNKKDAAQDAAQPQQEAVTPLVTVSRAEVKKVPYSGTYSATVKANVINNIAPQSAGRIRKINVEVGDFVKAGQVLAEMDPLQLVQAELQLSNISNEYERMSALYKKGAVSTSDFESIELQYKVSKSTYDNLLTNTILRSPVDGVVSARNYDIEDMYVMGQPLFVVQQISPVKLMVAVSEKDYANVKVGNKVEVVASAVPGEVFSGSVSLVYPVIDAGSHTVSVEVKVPNRDRRLRPGMYVSADVIFDTRNAVVVPDAAVIKQQGSGQRTVYVLEDDGTVTLKVVEVGRHTGGEYEIVSGLAEGEMVVVKGHSALRSGIKVQVEQ